MSSALMIAEKASLALGPAPRPDGGSITVETRLGPVIAPRNATIDMPQGPLGFARHTRFALVELPNPSLARFKLLQCLDTPEVSFVVAPVETGDGPIQPSDLDDACLSAGFAPGNLLVLLIVTVRSTPDGVALTANLRAPVIVDVQKRIGRQVVLANASYAVRHPI